MPAIGGLLAPAVQLVLRWRWAIMAALAAISAWLSEAQPVDQGYFAAPGGRLLAGHFGAVYSDPGNQGGPLQLIGSWLAVRVSHPVGGLISVYDIDAWAVAIANVGLVLLAMLACRAAITDPVARARRELLVGASVLLWLTPEGIWNGHPFEAVIPILWIAGLVLLRRERWIAAATVFGLSVAVAPWAVLAFPCLLAARRFRVAVRTAALASAIGVGAYLPFVFSGHFRMFHHQWEVRPGSLVHTFFPAVEYVGWGLRLGQALVVLLACGYLAWRFRGNPLIVVLAPLAAAILRVATDPVQLNYYWVPAGTAAIALVIMVPAGTAWTRMRLQVLAVLYLCWVGLSIGMTTVLGVLGLLLVGAVLVRSTRSGRGVADVGQGEVELAQQPA